MHVDFAFGKNGMPLELPDGPHYRVLDARAAAPLADAAAAIEAALDHPVGTPPLEELARGKHSAAISVCDITRPAPNRLVLPPILKRLEAAGTARENIVILIATGLHRPATEAEILEIVGPDIAAGYRVENHFAKNLSEHRHLGATRSGTPVYVDERFVAADLHITLGFIEPHLMLGFSGGRKLIAPGLAAQETIKVLHSPRFMRDSRTFEGSVEDNPLHAELLEIARMARHDFLVDVALGQGKPGTHQGVRPIAQVFAGHPEQAHACGMQFVSRVMLETLEEPVDAVITTSAGYPLDLTFYQAVKGVTAASHIVKPGGTILLLAECTEGAGAPEFAAMMTRFASGREFLDGVEHAPVTVDQWQLEKLALVSRQKRLLFYVPGLPAELREKLWGPAFDSAREAVAALLASLPASARVAVIPEGPYVLARAPELTLA
ncbi:MAG TPA: nickel-dependent lactate racemase [Solibacterales bacterium]|nr:nickel-dependent lactate racemase [Bryobacterales bacterium]